MAWDSDAKTGPPASQDRLGARCVTFCVPATRLGQCESVYMLYMLAFDSM